ncbi:MAG: hypothetical protein ABFD89_18195 [Bryobacteraceae bacterium]
MPNSQPADPKTLPPDTSKEETSKPYNPYEDAEQQSIAFWERRLAERRAARKASGQPPIPPGK